MQAERKSKVYLDFPEVQLIFTGIAYFIFFFNLLLR